MFNHHFKRIEESGTFDRIKARQERIFFKKKGGKGITFCQNRYFEDVSSSGGSVCPLSEAAAIGYDNLVIRPFSRFL